VQDGPSIRTFGILSDTNLTVSKSIEGSRPLSAQQANANPKDNVENIFISNFLSEKW
jgi:hypothetical protein